MIKQVIVMRKDLKMRRGKEIAQGSHASQEWLLKRIFTPSAFGNVGEPAFSPDEYEWLDTGHTKVTVYVTSEAELLGCAVAASEAGLTCHVVTDKGLTEFHNVPTKTCLAIGPNDGEAINKITGHLPLY